MYGGAGALGAGVAQEVGPAALLASDAGAALTGTWVHATAGMFPS
ncbi:hypothetical protein [Streptomyces gramineus]